MKKLRNFLIGLILLAAAPVFADADRFGSERTEVPRSTFSVAPLSGGNVVIATVTVGDVNFSSTTPDMGGSLVLRGIIFSGMTNSTVTFFDDIEFDGISTTRTVVEYLPSPNGVSHSPVRIDFNMFFSSGLIYNKRGDAPTTIEWDWLHERKSGDPRP